MSRASGEIVDDSWLEAFRRGDRDALEDCYRRYHGVLERAIGPMLGSADRETVVHEVFLRLLSEKSMRLTFQGPSMGAWLAAIARNRALDTNRRARRESVLPTPGARRPEATDAHSEDHQVRRLLLERFCREHLTPETAAVFETRFVHRMSQREAARHLGLRRTTLAYRELKLRHKLDAFMQAAS